MKIVQTLNRKVVKSLNPRKAERASDLHFKNHKIAKFAFQNLFKCIFVGEIEIEMKKPIVFTLAQNFEFE